MPGRSAKLASASLERNLANYAIAAGAAVGLLGPAQPAHAEIIYTPADVKLGSGGMRDYRLDVNQDGIFDLHFNIGSFSVSSTDVLRMYASGPGPYYSGGVQAGNPGPTYANARRPGGWIGPHKYFRGGKSQAIMVRKTINPSGTGLYGAWTDARNRYLGFKFGTNRGGETHYGWARLNVHVGDGLTIHARLTGYAYETVPGKHIQAGDQGLGAKSLGHLSLGAGSKAVATGRH